VLALEANVETLEVPLSERVAEGVELAYREHGYIDDGGERDLNAVEDKVFDLVSRAVVTRRAERGKLAVLRHTLVSTAFPNVPGPDQWAEQDEPEVAAGVYSQLDSTIWRFVDPGYNGRIQSRLNSGNGLILCRTTATPSKEAAVYVTKDLACLVEDFSGPHKAAMKKLADRFARNLAMATDRLPEFGSKFERELTGASKAALESSMNILTPALAAASAETESEA
jgi:hypothetical protein